MSKLNVLFVGDNRAGKTTFSRVLEELLMRGARRKVYRVSFGTGLRKELTEYYGVPRTIVDTQDAKDKIYLRLGAYPYDPSMPQRWLEEGLIDHLKDFDQKMVTLRELLIHHGTDIRRSEDTHYWNPVLQGLINALPDHDITICDDCRYSYDFDLFKNKPMIGFHLSNGLESPHDKAQQAAQEMVEQNSDRFHKLEVPVPLLDYTTETIIRVKVLPEIQKFYQQDGENE